MRRLVQMLVILAAVAPSLSAAQTPAPIIVTPTPRPAALDPVQAERIALSQSLNALRPDFVAARAAFKAKRDALKVASPNDHAAIEKEMKQLRSDYRAKLHAYKWLTNRLNQLSSAKPG